HVTYDQAVEMFNAQTATQQAMGQNPIVSSTKLKRVKYSSINDAQAEYSKQTIEKSLDLEKRILEVKETGNQSAKSLVEHINSYDSPTFDGIKGSDETKTKSVGDDASAPEIAPPKVFAKSCNLAPGEVCVGNCRELASDTGNISVFRSNPDSGSDTGKRSGGATDAMALGAITTAAGYRTFAGSASLEMLLDRAAISAGTALAELSTYGLRLAGAGLSTAFMLFYSPSLGDGTLYNNEDLLYRDRVDTLIRFSFDNEGKIHGYHVDHTEIPKRTVEKVGDKFVVDLEPGITIEWLPGVAETNEGNILVSPIPDVDPYNIYIHPEAEQGKEFDNTYITPVSDVEFNDYILTFPSDTGIKPLYIVYSSDALKYAPTAKHRKGGWGTEMDLSDDVGREVLNKSLQGGKQRYAYHDGKIYEFQPDNRDGWHGYPVKGTEAPSSVLKEMKKLGHFGNAEYKKLIKGK
ncbi:S-type pyocin domain-containing protein, partial [Vibrio sagamiensis]